MSNLTRRAFARRTGAVTLGTVLGVGMLPSVSRKLQAADTSGDPPVATGVTGQAPANQPVSYAYPPAAPTGTMVVSVTVETDCPAGYCQALVNFIIRKKAEYTETYGGNTYKATCNETSYFRFKCLNGQVVIDWAWKPSAQATMSAAVANVNNPSDTRGNLSISPTEESNSGNQTTTIKARLHRNGAYLPFVSASAGYSVQCCFRF